MMKLVYTGKLVGYNQRYCKGYILSKQYREFKEAIKFEFFKQNKNAKPLLGDLEIEIIFNSNHDCDNVAKAINDALEGLAFLNDKQIKKMLIVKNKKIKKGFIISIDELHA